MAVTLTVAELRAALRLSDSTEETAEATRLLAYASEAVTQHVENAPDVVHNEAVRRIAGYLYDMPEAGKGESYANALRNSGAGRILLPYRVHRAGYADAVESAQQAVGSADNPVTGIDVTGDTLTVIYLDGATETFTIATGTVGVDQTARTAAATAQTTADGAQTTADDAQTDIDDHEANHPSGGTVDQTARDAAQLAQDAATSAAINAAGANVNAGNAAAAAANAQTTADGNIDATDANALIATHTAVSDAHHAPVIGGETGEWFLGWEYHGRRVGFGNRPRCTVSAFPHWRVCRLRLYSV